MTGRELITYILENHLENEEVYSNGKFVGYLTVDEAAARLNVGPASVVAGIGLNSIPGVYVKPGYYIPAPYLK